MPDFPNLPAILRWEISLALLVLAWSLLSLGRYERFKRRLKRRRSAPVRPGRGRLATAPMRLVSPGDPAPGSAHVPTAQRLERRPHRLKVLAAAAGFASVAVSVAYAMPNIVHLDRSDAGERAARRPEPQEPRSPWPRPAVAESVAPQAAPPVEDEVEVPTRRPSAGHDLTVTVETEMVTSAATGASDPPPASVVTASSPTPEPSTSPTPTPVVTPTPTPSTPTDATPSPEPTQ